MWQTHDGNIAELADRMEMSINALYHWAWKLRKGGVPLKELSRRPRASTDYKNLAKVARNVTNNMKKGN